MYQGRKIAGLIALILIFIFTGASAQKPRARELGVPFSGTPGRLNAITDVAGVLVGHVTLVSGEGKLVVGKGPVRTGITAIFPRGRQYNPIFAGWATLNGNGEMTGTTWLKESGFLEGPILLTNTHSVGVARDALIEWEFRHHYFDPLPEDPGLFWSLPVVAETYDGDLNDINGFHVKKEDVFRALELADTGKVAEGNVGGGTGMVCHEFKGGIGTSSRKVLIDQVEYTIGVLVQANYGVRSTLTISGVPVGREITDMMPVLNPIRDSEDRGSIIAVVATDAPLLPGQLERIARRVTVGISRVGGYGGNSSGDLFIAFSTANEGAAKRTGIQNIRMLSNDRLSPLFEATAQATEEAIVNALFAAETMTGKNGTKVYCLPVDRVIALLKGYNRIR
ncbi:MAG TPA: P1 family peptidase [Bacteroidales bacterium]|nr:P1 family peptidase [Bacteroidales bacterium]